MEKHRIIIQEMLSGSDQRLQALFCLGCAERLRGCCWSFAIKFQYELQPFFAWSDALFLELAHASEQNLSMDLAWEELNGIVPDSVEDSALGAPLAVQAQSGVLCLLAAVGALKGMSVAVDEAVVAACSAADNYVYFINGQITGKTDGACPATTDYPLMRREQAQEASDAAFLASNPSNGQLTTWRIQNRQFLIPSAV